MNEELPDLREYLAGQALAGILGMAGAMMSEQSSESETIASAARIAVQLADATIEELRRK